MSRGLAGRSARCFTTIAPYPPEDRIDEKTLTAVSTSLALFQVQLNAVLLLLERQAPTAPIRDDFQRLVSEGVLAVGRETMESIKNRIRKGIVQQDIEGLGLDERSECVSSLLIVAPEEI